MGQDQEQTWANDYVSPIFKTKATTLKVILPAKTEKSISLSFFFSFSETMEFSLLVSLILTLISPIFQQPRALENPQELASSINTAILPSSIPLYPTIGSAIQRFPPPLVPALFVIGDSSVDCGTNNYLGTLARADRLPYGRDFDTHSPTGRFSNGRIPVDYLGEINIFLILFFFSLEYFFLASEKMEEKKSKELTFLFLMKLGFFLFFFSWFL